MKLKQGEKVRFAFEIYEDDEIVSIDGFPYNSQEVFDFEYKLLNDIFENLVFTIEWVETSKNSVGMENTIVKLKELKEVYPLYVFEKIELC